MAENMEESMQQQEQESEEEDMEALRALLGEHHHTFI